MRKFFRYLLIGIGVIAILAVIAITALFYVGKHLIAYQHTGCSESESFVGIRSQLKDALKSGTIDQVVMDRENKAIAEALEACASGDKSKAQAILMGVLMDASFQSDEVYARKVNGVQIETRHAGNSQGDPEKPKQNPHPVKRYEIVATANSPGPWDSVKGKLTYVTDPECTPKDYGSKGWLVPNMEFNFEMTRTGERTWKGYFFRDYLQDENYFGFGVCHWDAAHVSANFTVHGVTFQDMGVLYFDKNAHYTGDTNYFLKSFFFDKGNYTGGDYTGVASEYSHYDSDTTKHPEKYFTISASVEEATQ